MWYTALEPPVVEHASSQIGIRTTLPCSALTASTIFFAQLLPLSESTDTGNESHWTGGGLVTSESQLFLVPSRSRTMNEPPPVLHRGTMYSVPIGCCPGAPGSLVGH